MSTHNKARIAFLGLGVMGGAMVRNLVAHGFDVTGYDVSEVSYARLRDVPFARARSPREAASNAQVVITMLPTSTEVREALFGHDGAIQAVPADTLVLEMSTGDPLQTDQMAKELAALGMRFVDAPVGRTPQDAERGEALIMAGGDPDSVEAARPIFEAMANDIVYTGASGSAIRLKLVNNYMSMVTMVLTGEALMFAAKLGLDRAKVVNVLSNTVAGKGQLLTNYPRKVLAGDVSPDFPIRMGFKDINLAMNLAASVGAPLGLGGYAKEIFSLAKAWGREDQDCTALLLLLEDMARVPHQ